MKIHEMIESIREEKGITKTHIANKCGKTSAWYTNISQGKTRIDAELLPVIADALGVHASIFFEDSLSVTLNNEYKEKQAI